MYNLATCLVILFYITKTIAPPPSCPPLVWEKNFINGQIGSTSSEQCTSYNSFISSLPTSGVTQLRVYGSNNPTGYTCSDATSILDIFNKLKTCSGTTSTDCGYVTCNSLNWVIGMCGLSKELTVHATVTSGCTCLNSNVFIARPCVNTNSNWGAVDSDSCGPPPSQSLGIEITVNECTTASPETTTSETTLSPETTNMDTTLETTSSGTESMTTESGTDMMTTNMMTTDMISTTSEITTTSTIITGDDCECMSGKTNCQGKSIILMLIKKLMCGAINSCLYSKFKILETRPDPVEMECSENSFNWGQIIAKNMKSVKCKKGGCKGSKFELIGNINDGCNMDCDGDESCKNTNVTIENPKEIKCKGMTSCMGSQFNISKPIDNKCNIECSENWACKDTKWVINIESNTELRFKIEGLDSGRDSTIEINNMGTSTILFIDVIFECTKLDSCKNLKIIKDNTITITNSEPIKCEMESCMDITMNGEPASFTLINSNNNNNQTISKTNLIIIICISIITILITIFIILLILKNMRNSNNNSKIKESDAVKEDSLSIIENDNDGDIELLEINEGDNGQTTNL